MAGSRSSDGEKERRSSVNSSRWKNETMKVILTDPQVLDCYICCVPLSVPVYQTVDFQWKLWIMIKIKEICRSFEQLLAKIVECENGHISCSSCCSKVHNKCPSCSLPIGYMRCRAIEKVLESIKMPCQNSRYGCKTTTNLNQINEHETLCPYQPCSCPLSDCSYVDSAEHLGSHFRKRHQDSAKSISYNSRFTICLNSDDKYCIFQAENDGVLFVLSYSFETFGDAVTLKRIGPRSSEKKFCYDIKAKSHGNVLSLLSVAKEIQRWTEDPPSKGSLLIPNEFFGSSSAQTILEIRIWPSR
ncbi:E3 ubiquitin-protein ligase SINA-like 10 isoform X1 [Cucurbita maxima]|uniref:RING-type E3 ubiquitin transferase n=1 Tax=Cucurbita maxima TaxID=3661 RepID=A0A6J1KCJ8_CUCMA|nr:E3 ubiquitin-protein ligase SINA-like 10 isoform X1 [Cucurbita maxima]